MPNLRPMLFGSALNLVGRSVIFFGWLAGFVCTGFDCEFNMIDNCIDLVF